MYAESELSQPPGAMDDIADPQLLPAPAVPAPLKEVRDLKLRVQIGVYAAILGVLPIDYLAFAFSLFQILTIYIISMIIAVTAIEFAFAQMFKLRKQSAYPGVIVVQLGAVQASIVAYHTGLAVLGKLLDLRGSFLCLLQSGGLTPVAIRGMRRLQMENFLRVGAANVEQAVESGNPVPFHPGAGLLSDAVLPRDQVLVFVPVHSLQRTIGVAGLLARESNRDIMDQRLLTGMGLALGLSLENLRQKEELGQQAATDELTGVYNRRYFFEEVNREMALADRYSSPLAVAILDVDGLKAVNDRLGHAAGDEVLRSVALRLLRYSRASDLAARIGGDEFALILPRTNAQAAQEMAARLQWAVDQHPVVLADGSELSVAISCGTASFPEEAQDTDALLRRADAVMYCIKAARRQGSDPDLQPPSLI
ncbi:MAG: GGDEF domain-containing protein [Chloroflexi bacterium]|nr:GGDEF domain-containing protein [Chloroflexota bacterium]